MREIVDADAGCEAPLAAFALRRTEGEGCDLGIGVLVDEQRQRFEFLRDMRRHTNGQRHDRRILRRAGNLEDDGAVLLGDGAVAEGLFLERRPYVEIGLCYRRENGEAREGGSADEEDQGLEG